MKKGVLGILIVFLLGVLVISLASGVNETIANSSIKSSTPSSSSSQTTSASSVKTTGSTTPSANEEAQVTKGYQCLDDLVVNKSKPSFQESVFGALALGSRQSLLSALQSEKSTSEACWPKSGCKVKDTALAMIAYRQSGQPTADIEKWLLSKKSSPAELTWYLEIDTTQRTSASCTLRYDGRDYTTTIQEDMTFSNGAGSCLSPSTSGYWLRISPSCLSKSFEVKCDKDFISTLIYQKSGGETVYVGANTHSAPSLGTTNESVSASCFKSGSGCDYEGTLWAAFAFSEIQKENSDVLPYLIALSEDDTKYFPSAFLYLLTGDEEYYAQIISQRKQNQFWELTGSGGRFYDTSLALLALGGSTSSSSELDSTKTYLLNIQGKNGCWNNDNVRDTAFLLYSGWPRTGIAQPNAVGSTPTCIEANGFCELPSECADAGGSRLSGFLCSSGGSVCCSKKVERLSCASQKGKLCALSEVCSGTSVRSSEGDCCIGTCDSAAVRESACEASGGFCSSTCGKGEKEVSEGCTVSGDICCAVDDAPKGGAWIWIVILLLLIILAALAIMYKDKLRMWWYKRQGKASSTPIVRTGPSGPGSGSSNLPMRQPLRPAYPQRQMPQQRMPPTRPNAPSKDAEIDDTLRKLKEMSK